ncbi:type I-C CRISPR-associated protein Cas7/Csd2 [bacterium]|nr:type I-C CRISPR-associated protein Cas7/Csd2 [bacterium]MCP5463053.1 type I-C CRISPR-associated protein Cas7/Csd2 [bacterium]
MNPIQNRYDFVFIFDVKDGNPNGDPDQANLPRVDPENQEGLVTDVCIKRKVRNYVQLNNRLKAPDNNEYGIFIRQGNILAKDIDATPGEKTEDRQKELCRKYYDIRAFGAVMSVGDKGAGTVRGPVQFTFARSEDRVFQAEHSITRCCVTTENEAKSQENREFASTMGRKSTVPYALYRMHGFVSAVDAQKTGFSENDMELLWEALLNAFEHDRSAARGEMSARKLILFKHSNHLGNARATDLFSRVKIERKNDVPRGFTDYNIIVEKNNLPADIQVIEK